MIGLGGTVYANGGRYRYLDRFDPRPPVWTPEPRRETEDIVEPEPELQHDLTDYYDEMRADGTVKIFYGFGYEAYQSGEEPTFYEMLRELGAHEYPDAVDWSYDTDQKRIHFRDAKHDVRYQVDLGHERDAFASAFGTHRVVMYHGHSRYGRGPAFDSYWNYFRMGNIFENIEVDTRNPYFGDEPMQLTDDYPPITEKVDGQELTYQYRGQKIDSSYLPSDAYTKNIPGYDEDLSNASFLEGRQLVWLYSCRNVEYFKEPLRDRFPDPDSKFIFGTKKDGFWSEKPAAVFIMSVVAGVADSGEIVKRLDDTGDCGSDCFTSY
jgi:hypothetical protein